MLIGLSGFARSGKDTVAGFLVDDYDFVKMSFADPMREALLRLDPIVSISGGSYAHLTQLLGSFTWDQLKSISPDIRPLLQRFGTEVGREMFGQNFWVDQAMKVAQLHTDVVFSDVRFINEADAIKEAGGIVIRVDRPGTGPANSHISETELIDYDFDYTIKNSSDIHKLSNKVNVLLASMRAWS